MTPDQKNRHQYEKEPAKALGYEKTEGAFHEMNLRVEFPSGIRNGDLDTKTCVPVF